MAKKQGLVELPGHRRVTMKATAAGPWGTAQAGETLSVPAALAEQFVAGGYAAYAADPPAAKAAEPTPVPPPVPEPEPPAKPEPLPAATSAIPEPSPEAAPPPPAKPVAKPKKG